MQAYKELVIREKVSSYNVSILNYDFKISQTFFHRKIGISCLTV